MELIVNSFEDLKAVSKKLVEAIGDQKVWLFHGDMGAGKTTLIKNICQHLGVDDVVSSPTYSLVNEYLDAQQQPVYHFDFYRIENPQEALDIGLYDYLDSGNYCFIEWPERINDVLDEDAANLHIALDGNSEKRIISI